MECPVCSQIYPSSVINVHVNECLNSTSQASSDQNSALNSKLKKVQNNFLNKDTDSHTHSDTESDTDGDNQEEKGNVTYEPHFDKVKDVNENTAQQTSALIGTTTRKRPADWGSLKPGWRGSPRTTARARPTLSKKFKKTSERNSLSTGSNRKKKENSNYSVKESDQEREKESPLHSPKQNLAGQRPSFPPSSTYSPGQPSKPQDHKLPCTGSVPSVQCFAPLAERVRPKGLENYVGQEKAVGRESMLFSLLTTNQVPSMLLWGPPGCGKTTLARIIANNCRSNGNAKFVLLSAAVCGVNEVKETIKIARNDQKMFRRKTVMFLDEIHRFNKAQQDILLPHVEDGTITLIGATTENPSFQVNSALLSRCRVVVLEKLSSHSVLSILKRALSHIGALGVDSEHQALSDSDKSLVRVDNKALEMLSNLVDGDARAALNGLQMAVQAKATSADQSTDDDAAGLVTTEDIKEGLQRSHVLYDKTGEEHYNIISALHKSMRGSDASASLYWLARMLEGGENPLYVARRLIRFASEDIGLADPLALPQAVAAYQGCHLIGMPECDVLLAQCVVYLCRAPKSVEIYQAYGKAKSCVKNHKGPLPSVPLHLRNAPTLLMKNLGYSKGYKYNPGYTDPVEQNYFPEELLGTDFFS